MAKEKQREAASTPLLDDLAALDIDGMTPLDALTKLYDLREAARADNG